MQQAVKKLQVGIVLLNYGNTRDTCECLSSLEKVAKDVLELHVVIVDVKHPAENLENHKQTFQRFFPGVIILSSENMGFSGGNNLGIRYILEHFSPDYVCLLNNDTVVAPDFLEKLVHEAKKHTESALYVPKIYFAKNREFHRNSYTEAERGRVFWYAGGLFDWKNVYGWHRGVDEVDHGQFDDVEETQFATGCCMLIPQKTLHQIGLLDERYFLYMEDVEYSLRVKRVGGKVWYVPSSVVWHKNAGSSGGSGSDTHEYYQTRNRLLFGMMYARLKTKLALFKEAWTMITHGTQTQKEAIMDVVRCRFGKRQSGKGA